MFEHGTGVAKDMSKAFKWYRKAAEQDYVQAQYNLGVMYEHGKGVRKDKAKALEWYSKACDNGHEKSCAYSD
ncbi:tetratricopeptide repeat protein [Psychrobacter arenosus]|uniref:tetratricopeptide repeat protein n=1 Tax=Psychrobacter arenosus TaxID=256326 RepID=UPI0022349CA5|nr:tetratricopeptide repeat protein [Psychrobacter arenosus]